MIKKLLLAMLIALLSNTASAVDHKIAIDKAIGCTDSDYFKKLMSMIYQKDTEAFTKGFLTKAATGDCVLFSLGETVALTDTAVLSKTVERRFFNAQNLYCVQKRSYPPTHGADTKTPAQ